MSTQALAKNIVRIQYDDLPVDVTEVTKRSIIDTLGVILPPSTLTKACISLYELMNEEGGKKESTLLGFGGKAPCWVAAFINGSCSHAMDYDDGVTTNKPIQHPTASTLPAALAIAERIGAVNGKDFITAIALGNDLSVRIASCPTGNTMVDYPFFPISTFGVFSAAGACGKLLGLSEVEMQNTLGLALHRVAGTRDAAFAPDSDIRGIRDGFTNKEGVLAALMASKGISACKDAVEQLLRVYYGSGYSLKPLTENLGKNFRGAEVKFKFWPSCGATHSYIQAALYVAKEYDINPDQIEEVLLTGGVDGAQHSLLPEAAEPVTSIGAKFSIPFVVAVALVKRKVAINHFLFENLQDPDIIRIAKKIRFKVDPTFDTFIPVEIKIITKAGQNYYFRVDSNNVHTNSNLNMEELISKFKDCASYSKKQISSAKIDYLIDTLLHLEKVQDMREITEILV